MSSDKGQISASYGGQDLFKNVTTERISMGVEDTPNVRCEWRQRAFSDRSRG
jgi:hypothetical protein